MIDSPTVLYSKLNTRHNIMNYHYVWAMIAAGYIILIHIPLKANMTGGVSKDWGFREVYDTIIKPLFYHIGNIAALYNNDNSLCLDSKFCNSVDEKVNAIKDK